MGWDYFVFAVISAVVSYGISLATAPKPESPAVGQLDIPTAEQSTPIPVCFGTNLIKQTNVVWFGNSSTSPIKRKGGK